MEKYRISPEVTPYVAATMPVSLRRNICPDFTPNTHRARPERAQSPVSVFVEVNAPTECKGYALRWPGPGSSQLGTELPARRGRTWARWPTARESPRETGSHPSLSA